MIAVDEFGQLRGPRSVAEQIVWTNLGDLLKEVGERRETFVLSVVVQLGELRPMVREAVDLAVIKLRRSHRLCRGQASA